MSRLLRSGAVISAMTMISRIMGLIRDQVVARYFPVDGATDAFFVAFKIPNLLRRMFAEGAFSLAFVPILSEYKETKSREALQDLIDHVAGALALILFVVTLIGIVAAPLLIWVFAPGFGSQPDAQPALAADLLRITFPYILFISLAALVTGILNTFSKFAIPALTPVLLNIIMIIAAIWAAPYFEQPIMALAWGVFFAGIAQLVFQLPTLYKLGLMPKFKFKRAHEGVSRIMKLMLPAIFGSSVAQLNLLLNTIIASYLVVGSVSWLYFSDRFVELPLAIIGVAIGTVILPRLSSNHATKNESEFRQTLDWALKLGLIIALPATVGLILLAEPILATVMMYGAYTWRDVEMSGLSLMTYALGLPAFILVKLLAPGFYSRQDTKTPVRIGVIAVVSNMVFNLVIVLPWYWSGWVGAHAGLALATALAGFVNAGLLYRALRRDQVLSTSTGWSKYLVQLLGACVVSGIAVWLLMPAEMWWQSASALHRMGALSGLVAVSLVSYVLTLQLVGVKLRQMLAR